MSFCGLIHVALAPLAGETLGGVSSPHLQNKFEGVYNTKLRQSRK
jgi:hypothetical protein